MPGTAPTGWKTPKTSYTAADVTSPEQFERIEGNIHAIEQGSRTIDPSQAPTGVVGTLRQLLDWLANRIKTITGTTNWHDAPPTTLQAAKNHIDAAAPHSGHETPGGAQEKVDEHANLTGAHSATSAATANRIMMRDANGRAKVAAPAAADDIARKDTVDAKFDPGTGHKHTGEAGDGPKIPVSSIDGGIITRKQAEGILWMSKHRLPTSSGTSIAYSPSLGRLLIVHYTTVMYTSDDGGATWVTRSAGGATHSLNHVIWVEPLSRFVAVGAAGIIATSADGITWNQLTKGSGEFWRIGWDVRNNQLVVVGDGGAVYTSPDAVNWTSRTSGTTNRLWGIASSPARLVVVGEDSTVITSTDGVNWAPSNTGVSANSTLKAVCWSGSRFVIVQNNISGSVPRYYYSATGNNWEAAYCPGYERSQNMWAVATSGNSIVAVGDYGVIACSKDDGMTWTLPSAGVWGLGTSGIGVLRDVIWTGDRYLAMPVYSQMLVSPPE